MTNKYRWLKGAVHAPFVTDADAASWLNLEFPDYDTALFSKFVKAATARVERSVCHPLDVATYRLPLVAPEGTTELWKAVVPLPSWPNITDLSVAPYGVAGMAGNKINLFDLPPPGAAVFEQSSYFTPNVMLTAGEGTGDDFPQERSLVLRILTHVWENRGDENEPLPSSIRNELISISPFRGF